MCHYYFIFSIIIINIIIIITIIIIIIIPIDFLKQLILHKHCYLEHPKT